MALTEEQQDLLRDLLDSDRPRAGDGPTTVGRRIGTLAWIRNHNEAGQVDALVVEEDLAITRDLVDEGATA